MLASGVEVVPAIEPSSGTANFEIAPDGGVVVLSDQVAALNVGILYVFAIAGTGVVGAAVDRRPRPRASCARWPRRGRCADVLVKADTETGAARRGSCRSA